PRAQAPGTSRRPLALEELRLVVGVSDPRISPDGAWVAYVRATTDSAADHTGSDVVLLSASGGAAPGRVWAGSSPRWSPDGRAIAFSGTRGARSGIWVLDVASGRERFLGPVYTTDHWLGRASNKNFEWSPDGRWIAYVSADAPAATPPAGDVKVFSRIMYKTRTGFTDDRRTHVWVVGVSGEQARALTPGDHDEHSIAWAPDSRRIAFVSDRSADPDNSFANDIYVLDVGTGALTQLTRTPSAEFLPAWSPDGKWIAYEGWVRPRNTKDSPAEDAQVWVVPADGCVERCAPRSLSAALDRRAGEVSWHPGGRWVYFAAGDRGAGAIFRAPAAGGAVERLTTGDEQLRSYTLAERGGRMAYLRTDVTHPAEVYVADDDGRNARQLSHEQDRFLARVSPQPAQSFWFGSFDGTRVQGWLMKPAGFRAGERYPLILNVHGGPHGAYGYAFNDRVQLLAASGYGVLLINPRGSSGYGQRFSDGTLLNWGGGDYQDLMAGLDSAITANAWVDTTRLGVTGGSYGGFMTNWMITQTRRFKGAVSSASVSNLVSFYGTSLYTDLVEAEFNGMPWDNYAMLWQWSPLAHVRDATTPTLFIHGESDHDVPITQAEEMFVALRKLGVEATLARYPGEGHGLRHPSHIEDAHRRMLEWFDRHVKGKRVTTTSSR
ncbi:MAG TPA: S9 family peptidase, partial [Gemmatimonadaceae bacterium]|nr:S9 family peptidase [Gemmatimonadaceae bacterium]